MNQGQCPTGQHKTDFRQCGFAGCLDLREWAKEHRYRFRLEESYRAENNMHIRGDGRWFVEVLCKNGLIYPKGGNTVLAYAKSGVVKKLSQLRDIELHQTDVSGKVFKFDFERIDAVATILKPRKRKTVTPETLAKLAEARKKIGRGKANSSNSH